MLEWDAENRLVGITQGASVSTFVYDADGNRVKATADGVTTVYIGGYYEETAGTVRTYYYHGGQRVAMREGGVTTWLLADHLASTSVTYSEASGETASQGYYAWGTIRPGPENALPTDYAFTGQRLDAQINLYHMGARWYDAVSGRWISADSIVPAPGNPQSLNRFSYAGNNPYRYTDPTGHVLWIPIGAAVGALVGGGIAYGVQVAANMDRGMDLRQALATDIDADKIRQGVATGGIVGTLIGTGVGLVAAGALAAGAGTTAAGVATGVANAALSDDGGAGEAQTAAQLTNQALNTTQGLVADADARVAKWGVEGTLQAARAGAQAGDDILEGLFRYNQANPIPGYQQHHLWPQGLGGPANGWGIYISESSGLHTRIGGIQNWVNQTLMQMTGLGFRAMQAWAKGNAGELLPKLREIYADLGIPFPY